MTNVICVSNKYSCTSSELCCAAVELLLFIRRQNLGPTERILLEYFIMECVRIAIAAGRGPYFYAEAVSGREEFLIHFSFNGGLHTLLWPRLWLYLCHRAQQRSRGRRDTPQVAAFG